MSKNLIIDATTLQAKIAHPELRIIDLRPIEQYQHSHIPGAIHFDIAQFNRRVGDTAGLLPHIDDLNTTIQQLGIDANNHVVVYDDIAEPAVGRFAWTLLAFGHNSVSILDGGWQHWQQLNLANSSEIPTVAHSDYSLTAASQRITDARYILQHLNNDAVQFIDTRSDAEYHGTDIRSARGGHIPGAIHLNWTELKDPATNLFKPAEQLQELVTTKGIAKNQSQICYCQSHQRSALMCIVLEFLGYPSVKGYPGAWSDWGNREDSPIES